MRPFLLERASDPDAAFGLAGRGHAAAYLAGGTNLLDLMKLDVLRPETVVEIGRLRRDHGHITVDGDGLHLGAMVRMAEAAEHEAVRRDWPAIASALEQAASAQLRNMASLGGNVLQRTRCNYFRDTSWSDCNKRAPGSGCAAKDGVNRRLAVLGVSEHCIANYPGDFAIALVALDAEVAVLGPSGRRTIAIEELHRLPQDRPDIETTLRDGELITGFRIPATPRSRRSVYTKVRDRSSYDFALASAAVALQLEGEVVRDVRIGLGGLVAKPWRAREAEAVLIGRRLDEDAAGRAAEAAFAGAVTHGENDFKPDLGRRTLVRALFEARDRKSSGGESDGVERDDGRRDNGRRDDGR